MAQHIGNQRVGVPRAKPGKAPIDTFFEAVQKGGPSVKAPRPPKPPRAKTGPYTKGYKAPKPPKPPKPPRVPKVTPAQQRAAFEKGNRATSVAAARGAVARGEATVDKHGRYHYQPYNIRQAVGSDSANTLSLGGLADRASRTFIGPHITDVVEGKGTNSPLWAGIEAAGVLPFGKIGDAVGVAARLGHEAGPAERAIRIGEHTVTGPASRGVAGRAVQRTVDAATQRAINKAGGGMAGLANSPRYARANVRNLVKTGEFYRDVVERAPQEALAHTKMSAAKQMALRMVAHETPPDVWIRNNNRIIAAGASAKTVKNLRKENALIGEASRYVRVVKAAQAGVRFPTRLPDTADTVILSGHAPRDVHHAWGELLHTSRQMGEQGRALGRLTDQAEIDRLSAPGRFHRGARWQPGTTVKTGPTAEQIANIKRLKQVAAKAEAERRAKYPSGWFTYDKGPDFAPLMERQVAAQRALREAHDALPAVAEETLPAGLRGAEDFQGGRVYMPSTRGRRLPGTGQYKPSAADALAATVRGGSEFKHPYRGVLPLLGEESHNITQVAGQAALGRQRLYQGLTKLQHLQAIAVKPEDLAAHDMALSDKEFLKRWQPIKKVAQLADRTKTELDKALGKVDQGLHLTRSEENNLHKTMGDAYEEIIQHVTSLSDLNPEEIGFVPKAYIGDIHQYDPISRFDKIWGAISDPLKKAIVYTKVGHAGPRLVSNLFFNLGQQGVNLVPTAARTFLLSKAAPEVMRWADALMGEGSYAALGEGMHFSDLSTKVLVEPVRKIADLMPRRFAFVYEAQKAYGRPFQGVQEAVDYLNGLRTAPVGSAAHKTLINITQRARVAAGEYQRMSNFEKRKVSKFLFLYAWHRTAAVSTAKFAFEHPVQAAAAGYGINYLVNDVNKNSPPWEKFSVPLGGGTISNLSTSLPFSTPVEDAMKLKATGQHIMGLGPTPPLGEAVVGELNPSLLLPYMAMSGRDPETGSPLKTNPVQEFSKQTPIGALVSGKRTWDERIGKYLVGNPYPTTSSAQLGGWAPSLSGTRGSITPAQKARIMRLVKQAERNAKRAAARAHHHH